MFFCHGTTFDFGLNFVKHSALDDFFDSFYKTITITWKVSIDMLEEFLM
jgi:hypothetical protein